jgi:uncharacterized protein YuzE
MMHVDFDPEVRAWYLTLADSPVAKTVHISDEVAVDVDESDEAVGVEFLFAPAELDPAVTEALFRQFPAVRRALADLGALAVA